MERPAIPSDLTPTWRWNDRGFLARDEPPVVIAWSAPRAFDEARIYEAAWAARKAERGRPKAKGGRRKAERGREGSYTQQEMELK